MDHRKLKEIEEKIRKIKTEESKRNPKTVTKKMYELEINDFTYDIHGNYILRVPGGWIYQGKVFVPFHHEDNPKNISL